MCAKDIMQKDVLWANADDSVQQGLTKMQQADAGYVMVGTDGQFEGIISAFDIASTLSTTNVQLLVFYARFFNTVDIITVIMKSYPGLP